MNLVMIDPKDLLAIHWYPFINAVNEQLVELGYDPMTNLEARAMAEELEYEQKHSPMENWGTILPTFSAWHGAQSIQAQEECWR